MRPLFLVDHMLIKLGKYLRILGYDAAWDAALRTHELIVQMMMGAVVLICGCATAPKGPVVAPSSPAGKYYNTHDLASFTLLKPDGRFVVRENGGTLKGKYTAKGHTLLLTPDFQQVSLLGNINGRALIDNNGECWMRPPRSFTNRTVRDESFLVLQKRLPEGWLLRLTEGRYGLCRRPEGPPPVAERRRRSRRPAAGRDRCSGPCGQHDRGHSRLHGSPVPRAFRKVVAECRTGHPGHIPHAAGAIGRVRAAGSKKEGGADWLRLPVMFRMATTYPEASWQDRRRTRRPPHSRRP